jgi:hypothetical protein
MARPGRSIPVRSSSQLSAILLLAGFGALIAGWRTPWRYRWLLCVPSVGMLFLLVLTVLAFWPMNAALYYHGIHSSKDTVSDAQAIAMARRWVTLDWLRVVGAAAAFVAPLRALALPWPQAMSPKDPLAARLALALLLAGVAGFIAWFVSNL